MIGNGYRNIIVIKSISYMSHINYLFNIVSGFSRKKPDI